MTEKLLGLVLVLWLVQVVVVARLPSQHNRLFFVHLFGLLVGLHWLDRCVGVPHGCAASCVLL